MKTTTSKHAESQFTSIHDILKSQISDLAGKKFSSSMSLQKSWPQIVGPGISQHSKIMYVKNDRLYIEVDSSTWLNELSFMKEDILRKIKLMISDVLINEIWFKVRIKA